MNYTVDYFIKKFEAIPEDKWCINIQSDGYGRRCAFGHCHRSNGYPNGEAVNIFFKFGSTSYKKALALHNLLPNGVLINNGDNFEYQQPTPKQRILAALYDIKKAQQPEVKERIVYVTVDAEVRELQKTELSLQ